jgi:hypothetical protein
MGDGPLLLERLFGNDANFGENVRMRGSSKISPKMRMNIDTKVK